MTLIILEDAVRMKGFYEFFLSTELPILTILGAFIHRKDGDYVKKSRKVSKDKALKVLRERSHISEAKAEMERMLTSMIAASEYYNQKLKDYDKMKEIYDAVLESLMKPIVRLESACFVWMVNK